MTQVIATYQVEQLGRCAVSAGGREPRGQNRTRERASVMFANTYTPVQAATWNVISGAVT